MHDKRQLGEIIYIEYYDQRAVVSNIERTLKNWGINYHKFSRQMGKCHEYTVSKERYKSGSQIY